MDINFGAPLINGNGFIANKYLESINSQNETLKNSTALTSKYMYGIYTYWSSRINLEASDPINKSLKKIWPSVQFKAFTSGYACILKITDDIFLTGDVVVTKWNSYNEIEEFNLIVYRYGDGARSHTFKGLKANNKNVFITVLMPQLKLPIWMVISPFVNRLELIWKLRSWNLRMNAVKGLIGVDDKQDQGWLEANLKNALNLSQENDDFNNVSPIAFMTVSKENKDADKGLGWINLSNDTTVNLSTELQHEALYQASKDTWQEACRTIGIEWNFQQKNERVMSKEMTVDQIFLKIIETFTNRQYQLLVDDMNKKNPEWKVKLIDIVSEYQNSIDNNESKGDKNDI